MIEPFLPAFEPPSWLRNGRTQTVFARYWPGWTARFESTYHEVQLPDGDRLAVLESVPTSWISGGPAAILVHGLCGCARSPYITRVAARLLGLGVRVVRMNLRGAGAGFGLARGIYHGGRSEDLRATHEWLARRATGSPITLVGFSLGGNLALKLAAEAAREPLDGLDSVVAANPPIDLSACARRIGEPQNRAFDKHFVALLKDAIQRRDALFPDVEPTDLSQISSLYDFDERLTARWNGYRDAEHYYSEASAGPLLSQIEVEGLVVHAEDDPFIPVEAFFRQKFPPGVALELIPRGGHLGFFSRNAWDGDRRWLDARITAWFRARLARHASARVQLSTEFLDPQTSSWMPHTLEGDRNRHAACGELRAR